MKITATIFIIVTCLYTASAYADVADDLLNQFKECYHFDADSIKHDFDAALSQTYQCWKTAHEDFLGHYPDSPAAWHVSSTATIPQQTHIVTSMEAKHLMMIMKGENRCKKILLNYSDSKDTFTRMMIMVYQKNWDDEQPVFMNYIKGKITLGELFNKFNYISNITKAMSNDIFDADANAFKARRDERYRFCNAQLQANKQNVLRELDNREAIRTIAHQNQEIQQLKQRADDSETRVLEAEFDADRAKSEADAAKSEAAISQQQR